MAITQVEPVTALQRSYQAIFDKLPAGPVVLSNHGKAAAILLSVDEYDRQQARLRYYERQHAGDLALIANEWVSDEEVSQGFAELVVES